METKKGKSPNIVGQRKKTVRVIVMRTIFKTYVNSMEKMTITLYLQSVDKMCEME